MERTGRTVCRFRPAGARRRRVGRGWYNPARCPACGGAYLTMSVVARLRELAERIPRMPVSGFSERETERYLV